MLVIFYRMLSWLFKNVQVQQNWANCEHHFEFDMSDFSLTTTWLFILVFWDMTDRLSSPCDEIHQWLTISLCHMLNLNVKTGCLISSFLQSDKIWEGLLLKFIDHWHFSTAKTVRFQKDGPEGTYIHQMSYTRDDFSAKISLKEHFWQDLIGE